MYYGDINTDQVQTQDIQDIGVSKVFDITKRKLTYKCKYFVNICFHFVQNSMRYEHMHLKCLAANAFNNLQDYLFTIKPWDKDGENNENF